MTSNSKCYSPHKRHGRLWLSRLGARQDLWTPIVISNSGSDGDAHQVLSARAKESSEYPTRPVVDQGAHQGPVIFVRIRNRSTFLTFKLIKRAVSKNFHVLLILSKNNVASRTEEIDNLISNPIGVRGFSKCIGEFLTA